MFVLFCRNSNPVLISSPRELAGMTLESRLLSYDWQNQFDKFQQVTRRGSFKPLCWGAKNHLIPVSFHCKPFSFDLIGFCFTIQFFPLPGLQYTRHRFESVSGWGIYIAHGIRICRVDQEVFWWGWNIIYLQWLEVAGHACFCWGGSWGSL